MKGETQVLRTSDIARAVGVHPNTVRLYEQWGFLPSVPRNPSGYRLFTVAHLDQMRLARAALHGAWPGRRIRRSAVALVRKAASGDLSGAQDQAREHLALVQAERAQAEAAANAFQHWAQDSPTGRSIQPLWIGEAAQLLDVTTDTLRSWERNGLLEVGRDLRNGYRLYGPAEIRRLRVIRLLARAGYSTMAILRALLRLDRTQNADLRQALDTPRPDEDVYSAADRWLSTLAAQEQRALDLISQLDEIMLRRRC